MERRALKPLTLAWPARLLLVSRPALWINTLGVGVVGLWLAGRLWTPDPHVLALLLWLTWPYNLLIYGLNDLSDGAEDALSARKGGWQGARLRRGEVRPLPLSILALNLPFALYFALRYPPGALGVLLLSAALFALYSLPPARLKGRAPLDSLANVAYALPLVVPALLLNTQPPLGVLAALMAWAVGKHAFDAAQDTGADAAAGVRTIAVWLGVRGAARWSLAWFALAGALLWPHGPAGALVLWTLSGGLALDLLRRPCEARARALYPASLLSPWLLGVALGMPLVYLLARGG